MNPEPILKFIQQHPSQQVIDADKFDATLAQQGYLTHEFHQFLQKHHIIYSKDAIEYFKIDTISQFNQNKLDTIRFEVEEIKTLQQVVDTYHYNVYFDTNDIFNDQPNPLLYGEMYARLTKEE